MAPNLRRSSEPRTKVRAEHAGLRKCVACRKGRTPSEMIRIVRGFDARGDHLLHVLAPGNVRGGVAGRGASVCASESCIAILVKRRPLGRTLRCDVTQDLYDHVASLLRALVTNDS